MNCLDTLRRMQSLHGLRRDLPSFQVKNWQDQRVGSTLISRNTADFHFQLSWGWVGGKGEKLTGGGLNARAKVCVFFQPSKRKKAGR